MHLSHQSRPIQVLNKNIFFKENFLLKTKAYNNLEFALSYVIVIDWLSKLCLQL